MLDFVIVLDANERVGFGHLFRSLALIEYLREKNQTVALLGDIDSTWCSKLVAENVQLYTKSERPACRCLVVDSYEPLDKLFISWPKDLPVVLYEDTDLRRSDRPCLVVNALGHTPTIESHFPYAQVVCGLEYQLFRQSIRKVHSGQIFRTRRQGGGDSSRRILLSLGGSDQTALTHRILKVLVAHVPETIIIDVVGAFHTQKAGLPENIVFHGEYVENFTEMAIESDLVICGAGQTLLEMHFLSCRVIGIVLAENQLKCAKMIQATGHQVITQLNELEAELTQCIRVESLLEEKIQLLDEKLEFSTANTRRGSRVGTQPERLIEMILACKK